MTRRGVGGVAQMRCGWRPGMVGVWSVRVRHVLWLLLLWMVCGLHLLYLFASYSAQTSTQEDQQNGLATGSSPSGPLLLQTKKLPLKVRLTPGEAGGRAGRPGRLGGLINEQEEDQEEAALLQPHLEGQQLRHLADIGSLISRRTADSKSYDKSANKGAGSSRDSDQVAAAVPDIGALGHRKDGTQEEGQTLLQNRPLPVGGTWKGENGTGNVDAQWFSSSGRPDGWIACPSVVAPGWAGETPGDPLEEEEGEGRGWQVVRPGQSYVFSAYHDTRPLILGGKARDGAVRVIGLTDTHVDGAPQFCQLWYAPGGSSAPDGPRRGRRRKGQYERRSAPHQQQPTTLDENHARRPPNGTHTLRARLVVVPAISDIVPETHGLRFAPFIYTCKLGSGVVPVGVSLTHSRCDTPLNYLRIKPAHLSNPPRHDQHHHHRHPHNYTVCVTPFNFNYNNVDQLVEKVEVDRIMGANRFIFYNYSSGPDVAPYLQAYVAEGVAEIVQWKLPVRVDSWPAVAAAEVDVHYFGQLAALNDCLYRAMFDSKMVVFTDMDELIVPKKHRKWRDMVAFLHHKGQGSAGTFIFQNSFFRTEWTNDNRLGSGSSNALRIMSLAKTKRERYIYPWGMRSKYICDPLKVEMVGVHNIWRFVNESFTELDVPADIGLLHHYRSWNKVQEENSVLDRSMHAYYDVIVSHIRERHVKVQEFTRTVRRPPVRPSAR